MHAKRVGIYVNRQRYKCRECNETFFENLPDMDVNRSVTNRLINWIQEASLEKTFTSVAEEIGVDEKTVRNIFNDYVDEIKPKLILELLNGLVLMKSICLKTIVVSSQMLKTSQ
ncbi:helix-turn-helix domain-containing protein [Metabacillus malikii]|uniref:Transposase-like protein n=1 Tax=Metabacillus malikii TaxID=1504265 RepID=A0ABT9ZJI4_9BACI|nr:helix-turn-helix domain-containing protein [Metabacillus malikii]MDQ0232439.1 transposase-like protein [Metabacillus malikii]